MSAFTFKLFLYLCVYQGILHVNSIQNLRYLSRFDRNQWQLGKRQDLPSQSRYFMWKTAMNPSQLKPNIKLPIIPYNFNRFVIPPPPAVAPILQNYMFTMPTKVDYPFYQQMKDINEKRKPGSLHHITILNAIMPKSYLPTPPTYTHSTNTFRNYIPNDKHLHQPYFNNFGHQNIRNLNTVNTQQIKLQQSQQHQMTYPLSTFALKMNKPSVEYKNLLNYNTHKNSNETDDIIINNALSQCGHKTKNDPRNSTDDIMYYYCNNRITNYKNPTQYQIVSIQTTTTPMTTSTTNNTTEQPLPSTTTVRVEHPYFNIYTTEKTTFLPTPNEPLEVNNVPVASLKNDVTYNENDGDFNQGITYSSKEFEDLRPKSLPQYQSQQTVTRYDNLRQKQQQQYATTTEYDNVKLYSFFTIEDAVTRTPEMQVFNDPYQAYRYARRSHHNHQRQNKEISQISTPTPSITTKTSKKVKYRNFFDDLENENIAHLYDYSFFDTPQKSVYKNPEYRNPQKYIKPNQITYKVVEDNSFSTKSYHSKPNIKEHSFGLFQTISPTIFTIPPITTYKPYDQLRESILTAHKIPSTSHTYKSKSIPITTTDLILEKQEGKIKAVLETTSRTYPIQIRTSTIIPITTTTEEKANIIKLKSPFILRSFRRGLNTTKSVLTSTTTSPPTLKKLPKYQRQYKTKRLKKFKHLFTTTSTTTSTTTTTIPTTVENYTKKSFSRIYPTISVTEEPITKNSPSRIISTMNVAKTEKYTERKQSSMTGVTNRKKKVTRISTESTTSVNTLARKQASRRGSKRINKTKTEDEVMQTKIRRRGQKNRHGLALTSTTPKSEMARTTSSTTFTTFSIPATLRTSSTSATTGIRSIMRTANSKSRSKPLEQNEFSSPIKSFKDTHDESETIDKWGSLKSIKSTGVSIPPLPIEIYFKKSLNSKI